MLCVLAKSLHSGLELGPGVSIAKVWVGSHPDLPGVGSLLIEAADVETATFRLFGGRLGLVMLDFSLAIKDLAEVMGAPRASLGVESTAGAVAVGPA